MHACNAGCSIPLITVLLSLHAHLERCGHVGEVSDAPSDDEDLALRVFFFGHQTQDCLGILKRLTWGGGGGVKI